MLFNMNNYVEIKLTDAGRAELKRQHDELAEYYASTRPYIAPTEDEAGWSRWQMHTVMNTFGHLMTCGFDLPFETDIKIKSSNDQEQAHE